MRASKAVLILMAAVLLPSLAFAQGTLTGTVKDQSGSVLPGVTVEASSPVLIEKVRTGVTDGAGHETIRLGSELKDGIEVTGPGRWIIVPAG